MPTNNAALYGLGKGAATVYNPEGVVNDFSQILARQQAQRQQELKQLTDQQAQLKPDGLRNDADRKDFFNQANDWRQRSINAMNERDPYKKSLLQSQAQQAYMQAQATVAKSKAAGVKDNAFQQFAMNNATRHQLTDDAVQNGLKNANLGVNDPNYINDYSTLQRAPDYDAFDKRNKELHTERLNGAVEKEVWGKPIQVGSDTVTPWSKVKNIDVQALAHDIMNEATFRPEYAIALEKKYPDLYANAKTDDDFHMAHAQAALRQASSMELNKTGSTGYLTAKETDDEKAALHARNRLFDQNHPISNGTTNALTPAQILIAGNPAQGQAGMLQGNMDAMKRIISLTPKNQYGKAQVPDPFIDPNTSEHVFRYPAQVKPDEKAIEANNQLKARYNLNPEKKDKTLGLFGGTKIPYEQSEKYKEDLAKNRFKPETKIVKPAAEYRLNPADPQGYVSQASQMATDQNIKLPQLNQILGGKGGRGMIEPQKSPHTTIKVPKDVKLY